MINKIINKIKRYYRVYCLNKTGNFKINKSVIIDENTFLEGFNEIGYKTILINTHFGKYSYIANNCKIINSKIGKYCSIGENVKVICGNHPTSKFVSTHPIFYSKRNYFGRRYTRKSLFNEYTYVDNKNKFFCIIGNDVWIGTDVSLINGVEIGNGVIIAAGSVVTKNIPPYEIWGGAPAKFIKKRFEDEEIEFLENLEWWDKEDKWINKNIEFFQDIKMRDKLNN